MIKKNQKESINNRLVPTVIFSLITILFGFALFSGNAAATPIPINGTITFYGNFSVDATGLTFFNPMTVMNATGDLTSTVGGSAIFQDLKFGTSPISNFWNVSDFSLDLNHISIEAQTADFIVISGGGIMHGGTGFEDTPGNWSFSSLYGTSQFVSGTSVPDASIMLLLGISLLVLGVLSRKKYRTV